MPVYDWQLRPTRHFGQVWVPIAELELFGSNGKPQYVAMQIDTGAVVSLLRKSMADLLAIPLESGRLIEVIGIGGTPTIAYVHSVRARFNESFTLDLRFAIADTENVPNLLGRLDVFDSLRIVFDPVNHETQVTSP